MSLNLSLVVTLFQTQVVDKAILNVDLLQKANAWLQRLNAGQKDQLIIVGVGFQNLEVLKNTVTPYGLGDADLITAIGDKEDDGVEIDQAIAKAVVQLRWMDTITIVNWKNLEINENYPLDGWWWVGVKSTHNETAIFLDAEVRDLVQKPFQKTYSTWLSILTNPLDLDVNDGDYFEYEAKMNALTLARWLNGFNASTDNSFYDFDCKEAINKLGPHVIRLGLEAAYSDDDQVRDLVYVEVADNMELEPAILLLCLRQRTDDVRTTLVKAFGNEASLFWSLYDSIWPELEKPMDQVMDDLLNLTTSVEMGEIERPWLFVTKGWINAY